MVEAVRHSREAIVTTQRRRQRRPDATDVPSEASAKAEHDNAVDELMRNHPGVARAFTIAPVHLTDLQKVLPGGAAVVIFTIGAKASDALIIRNSGPKHIDLAVTRSQLTPLTHQLREALRAFGPVEASSAEIAKALLTPIEAALEGVTHLVIMPQGMLVGVPFEALPWKNAMVVDAMATSYTPSSSLLVDVLTKPKRGPIKHVAAVAYGQDLPFARLEALAVAGDAALIDYAATETAVRALRVDAVDIAAHGDMSSEQPMSGALALAQGANDDGRLELREIFGAPTLAPLVSVSACTLGDGWTGWQALASAFFASGTQTIIAAEDRISDLAAGVLMKRFYQERKATGSEALTAPRNQVDAPLVCAPGSLGRVATHWGFSLAISRTTRPAASLRRVRTFASNRPERSPILTPDDPNMQGSTRCEPRKKRDMMNIDGLPGIVVPQPAPRAVAVNVPLSGGDTLRVAFDPISQQLTVGPFGTTMGLPAQGKMSINGMSAEIRGFEVFVEGKKVAIPELEAAASKRTWRQRRARPRLRRRHPSGHRASR